jgi:hypothetical protein
MDHPASPLSDSAISSQRLQRSVFGLIGDVLVKSSISGVLVRGKQFFWETEAVLSLFVHPGNGIHMHY